jgi:hypothetical protein
MKKSLKNLLRVLHIYLSQMLIGNFFKEFNSFKKINKSNRINIKLKKEDLNFIEKTWVKFHDEIVTETSNLSFLFFNSPSLIKTMTADSFNGDYLPFLDESLKYLKENDIIKLIKENNVGGSRILINSLFSKKFFKTSITRSVHVYQFSKLKKIIDLNLDVDNEIIVEWGGGYGGLANVFYKFYKFKQKTYIIVDIPVSIKLQYCYLATVHGEDNINVVENSGKIEIGKINLLRLSELNNFNIESNIFISSWAISESNKYSQDFSIKNNFFNSKYSILFHQKNSKTHPYAEYLSNYMKSKFEIIDSESVPVFLKQYCQITKHY